jgi:hypothetical protein
MCWYNFKLTYLNDSYEKFATSELIAEECKIDPQRNIAHRKLCNERHTSFDDVYVCGETTFLNNQRVLSLQSTVHCLRHETSTLVGIRSLCLMKPQIGLGLFSAWNVCFGSPYSYNVPDQLPVNKKHKHHRILQWDK